MKKSHLFWTEAANTITHLENITIRKGNTRTPYYLFYCKDAPYTKYLQVYRQLGIVKVLEPTNKLSDKELKAYSDADFAGNKEALISLTGYVVYFMNVPVCWSSCGQKSVTLSTTEAEYVACSEVMKEVLFILQLLRHLQVKIQLPIRVHVDNIRAIFLTENQNSSDRTKHDTRYHFVRQYTG